MSDRCTGHCCEAFFLPFSPEKLSENYRAWRHQDFDADGKDKNGHRTLLDIHLLAPMVRHLGLFKAGDIPPTHADACALTEDAHFYTCVHLTDGMCSIYNIRPAVCSGYPYGKPCKYPGCSWDDAESATKGDANAEA